MEPRHRTCRLHRPAYGSRQTPTVIRSAAIAPGSFIVAGPDCRNFASEALFHHPTVYPRPVMHTPKAWLKLLRPWFNSFCCCSR